MVQRDEWDTYWGPIFIFLSRGDEAAMVSLIREEIYGQVDAASYGVN